MISATCHCGAIRVDVPHRPETLTNCNCSLCRRIGGLWAYYPLSAVRITGHPEHTDAYIWGDKTLKTISCCHCGCITHWEPLEPGPDSKLGVNARNFEPEVIVGVQVRRFDGADTWTFLD